MQSESRKKSRSKGQNAGQGGSCCFVVRAVFGFAWDALEGFDL